MNYTKNYHLPQWVKSDRIMMEDFNSAMSGIDTGLTTAVGKANSAISTADSAKSLAQQTAGAAYTPDNKPFKVGSYVGTGQTLPVELGFRPSFLIIAWGQTSDGVPSCHIMVTDHVTVADRITFTDTGFTLRSLDTTPSINPMVNDKGNRYNYIAFK